MKSLFQRMIVALVPKFVAEDCLNLGQCEMLPFLAWWGIYLKYFLRWAPSRALYSCGCSLFQSLILNKQLNERHYQELFLFLEREEFIVLLATAHILHEHLDLRRSVGRSGSKESTCGRTVSSLILFFPKSKWHPWHILDGKSKSSLRYPSIKNSCTDLASRSFIYLMAFL